MKIFLKNLASIIFFSSLILLFLVLARFPINLSPKLFIICLASGLVFVGSHFRKITIFLHRVIRFIFSVFQQIPGRAFKNLRLTSSNIIVYWLAFIFIVFALFQFISVDELSHFRNITIGLISFMISTLCIWQKGKLAFFISKNIFPISFIVISLTYAAVFFLFNIGHWLVYEDISFQSKEHIYEEVLPGIRYKGIYRSNHNNLGVIYLQFLSGETPSDEGLVSAGEPNSFPLSFSIAEYGGEPFYENEYVLLWGPDQKEFVYEFGFPPQNFSQAKNYLININVNEYSQNKPALSVALDNSNELLIRGKYVVRAGQMFEQIKDVVDVFQAKLTQIHPNKTIYFLFSMFGILLLTRSQWSHKAKTSALLASFLFSSLIMLFGIQLCIWLSSEAARNLFLLSGTYLAGIFTVCALGLFVIHRKSVVSALYQSGNPSVSRNRRLMHAIYIILIVLCAAVLRLLNIGQLNPNTDEYPHLISAKEILTHAQLLDEPYIRSYHIVTLPVSLAFKVWRPTLEAARTMGVIFSLLAMIPLYLISRRVNVTVARLSLLFYALSPWVISLSRGVREYAYHPFYYFWIIYFMVKLYEALPEKINLAKDFSKLFSKKVFTWAILLILPAMYVLYLGEVYTFRIVGLSYFIFSCLLLTKLNYSYLINRVFLSLVILSGLFIGFYILPNQQFFDSQIKPNWVWLSFIFGNPPQQWYYNTLPLSQIVVPLISVIGSIFVFKKNKWPFFFVSHFLLYFYFFIFHFERYSEPRYMHSVGLWYVLVLAIGVSFLISLFKVAIPNKSKRYLLIILLFFLTFNIKHIGSIPIYNEYGKEPISGRFHDYVQPTAQFLRENASPEDVLIGSNVVRYLLFNDGFVFKKYYTNYHWNNDTLPSVLKYIDSHNSGWVVTDSLNYHRYGFNYKRDIERLYEAGNVSFQEYKIDEQYLLRWEKRQLNSDF